MIIIVSLLFSYFLANESIIEAVNRNPNATWVAGRNRFTGMSTAELRIMFNQEIIKDLRKGLTSVTEHAEDAPKEFDARKEWPKLIHPIRDQQKCGSCWAFAGTEVLSDRFAISNASKGVLSPQDLVSCDLLDHGCQGGSPLLEWTWMSLRGVATDDCIPYVSGNGSVPRCPRKCIDGSVIERHKAKHFTYIPSIFIENDLQHNGPQEFCMMVYQDFMSYQSGIYKHIEGELLGGHAVKSIGWGEDPKNGKYWILANSWGKEWGENGYFRIVRGSNECSIESMVYAGTPKVD